MSQFANPNMTLLSGSPVVPTSQHKTVFLQATVLTKNSKPPSRGRLFHVTPYKAYRGTCRHVPNPFRLHNRPNTSHTAAVPTNHHHHHHQLQTRAAVYFKLELEPISSPSTICMHTRATSSVRKSSQPTMYCHGANAASDDNAH